MISYDKFIEKFPTTESFEQKYPAGKKVMYNWMTTQTIVGHIIDEQFSNKEDFAHLVVTKRWSRERRRWYYSVQDVFVFYSSVEMIERELKESKKREEQIKRAKEKAKQNGV